MPKPPTNMDWSPPRGVSRIMAFSDPRAGLRIGETMARFALTQTELQAILDTTGKLASSEAQRRLVDMLDIIERVRTWTKTDLEALDWYRNEPISAFGGETPAKLVSKGMSSTVRDYIEHIALGGHA